MKKFSIITPCYKQAHTLSRLIKSVQDQNYPEKEIIVVLDGEDRDAEKILKMYPSVKWTCTGKYNQGAPVARNLGATMASGDYYAFLDSDMYLFPGALRTWAETFDENPEADFVYGGYKFTEGGVYFSEPFDPYFLRIYNYIDGNFPLKKEVFPGWDPNLKSLQDWDMWLRIVDKGGKGHYLSNQFFFAKDLPKPGSISYDSNKHWHERIKTVKDKHNIKPNDICLTSFAAPHHARRVAKVMGLDWVEPILLFNKSFTYKLVYLIGHFPGNAVNNILPFMDSSKEPPVMNEKLIKVIHWIGTDILQMHNENMSFAVMRKFVDSINKHFIQYCQSEQNKKELEELGLKVKCLPLPIETERKNIPLPKDFTVAVYDHGTNDIYNEPMMIDIAESMPHIKFIFFGNERRKGETNIKNLSYVGRQDIDDIVKQSSVLLRITQHDGFPVSPVEFMCRGRAVITNQEVMDDCFYIPMDLKTSEGYAKAKKAIMHQIRKIKKRYPSEDYFNQAHERYKRIFNPNRLRNELLGLL